MFTIFINDRPIYLTTSLNNDSKKNFFHVDEIDVLSKIALLENGEIQALYLYDVDIHQLWETFQSNFKIIEAAGGVVKNKEGKTLFIYRNDTWDLPKGKLEKGEKIDECAIREVEEECGISGLTIQKEIEKTYHIYKIKEKCILKVTHWFLMETYFNDKLIPQGEEGITKVEWLNEDQIKKALSNSYANIRLLLGL